MSTTGLFLSKTLASVRNTSAAPFAKPPSALTAASAASLRATSATPQPRHSQSHAPRLPRLPPLLCAPRPQHLSRAIRKVALRAYRGFRRFFARHVRNTSAAPFAKPRSALTAASAASLLIFWRSLHEKNCAKIHASMILHSFLHG